MHFHGCGAIWTRLSIDNATEYVAEPLPLYVAEILQQKGEAETKVSEFGSLSVAGSDVC